VCVCWVARRACAGAQRSKGGGGLPVARGVRHVAASTPVSGLWRLFPPRCVPVFLEAETADHFYNGYCNNVLWPLLHYIPLSMLDAQAQLTETQWAAYQRANQDFADTVPPPCSPAPSRCVGAEGRSPATRAGSPAHHARPRTASGHVARARRGRPGVGAGLPPDAPPPLPARAHAQPEHRLVPAHALLYLGGEGEGEGEG
jgi:hypothetical protein